MTPIPDSVIPAAGTQLQLSRRLALIGAGGLVEIASASNRADILIPSCNQLGPLSVQPLFDGSQAPLTMDMSLFPVQLAVGDPIAVEQAEALDYTVGLFLSDGIEPVPAGPVAWVRYTPGNTADKDAAAWQDVTLQFATQLPAGQYRILAIRHVQPEIEAVRMVLAGSSLRPGGFAFPAAAAVGHADPALPGPTTSGVMGVFDAIAPPSLQVFRPTGTGTGSAGTGYLLLQRVDKAGCGCGGSCGGCGGR